MGVVPPRDGNRLGVFQLISPGPGSAVLIGEGGRYRIRLVVLTGDGQLTFVTFVQSRGAICRQLLKPILVGHRRVAPRVLDWAVATEGEQPSQRA